MSGLNAILRRHGQKRRCEMQRMSVIRSPLRMAGVPTVASAAIPWSSHGTLERLSL
jgi:hypothetical protein